MAQTIIADISTRGANPVAYTHQGDTDRTFFVELYENGEPFAVAGFTAKVGAILPADRGYTVIAGNDMVSATKSNDGTNKLFFTLTEKYTRKAGNGILTLILTTNTGTPAKIRPINIDLRIQRSADADDTIAGASDFPATLSGLVANWCEANVTPIIDPTLSRAGYVADAKATGDALNNFYSSVLESESITVDVPYYTDLVATSKAAPSSSAAGYGTDGLQNGYTLKGDGSLLAASANVTGYIPFEMGDVIRIKQKDLSSFDQTTMIVLFNDGETTHANAGKTVENILGNSAYGTASVSGNVFTWDTSTASYYTWSQMTPKWFRFASVSTEPVATVNEQIIEGTHTIVTTQPILNHEVKVKEENLDFDVDSNLFADKKICCIGDSLFGLYRGSTSTPAYVAERTGATVYNCGFGGCRMSTHPTTGYAAFSMWKLADAIATGSWTQQNSEAASGENYFSSQLETLKSINFNSLDYMVIHYGTNDYNANVALDNANSPKSTSTICGALRYSIERILTAYPNIKIYVSLPIYRMWDNVGAETHVNSNGITLVECVEALKQVAESYGVSVIDGYHNLGMNAANFATFASDKTHLTTEAGRKRFGWLIGGVIETYN